jgi:hypothetical protein
MLYRGTDNLRCYVREAVLPIMINAPSAPEMPMEGHKSHLNLLRVRPERYRTLESMYHFKRAAFDEALKQCRLSALWHGSNGLDGGTTRTGINTHIPHIPLGAEDEDERTGERLTISSSKFKVSPHKPQRPSDILRQELHFFERFRLIIPSTPGFQYGSTASRYKQFSASCISFTHTRWTGRSVWTKTTM